MNRIAILLILIVALLSLSACDAINLPLPATPIPPTQVASITTSPTDLPPSAVPTDMLPVETATSQGPEVEEATAAPTTTPTDEPTVEPTNTPPPTPTPTATPVVEAPADGTVSITHGPLSGEVTSTSAVLWARAGVAGTLTFSVSQSGQPDTVAVGTTGVDGTTDFTGEVLISGLESATAYTYTVTLETAEASTRPVVGTFTTAPAPDQLAAFDFVMGADIGGQGYCRDQQNGWLIFDTIHDLEPDFFLMTGDGVYVDTACAGDTNVPGSEGPFRTLEGFRSRYKYTLADPHYAGLLAETSVYPTWDDHEVVNDFGGPQLNVINPQLFHEGREAFFEFWPIMGVEEEPRRIYRSFQWGAQAEFFVLDTRTYRDPNVNFDPNPVTLQPKTMLGAEQKAWLKTSLQDSTAAWKFVVTSVPLSYPTGFPQPQVEGRDGWANFTEQSGYETELVELITFIEAHDVQNVIFLTADVHWPFAMSYDPDRDGVPNFYEFGSGPLSAITLPPATTIDPTLNPTVLYAEGEFQGNLFNFGQLTVDEAGALTFRIIDQAGEEHFELILTPDVAAIEDQ